MSGTSDADLLAQFQELQQGIADDETNLNQVKQSLKILKNCENSTKNVDIVQNVFEKWGLFPKKDGKVPEKLIFDKLEMLPGKS